MKVYIAAPYAEAVFVRKEVFALLRGAGLEPVATWAIEADGLPENLFALGKDIARSRWIRNRTELLNADAVLVIARQDQGGEMFAEIEAARFARMPIFWTGRHTLSAFDRSVCYRTASTALEGLSGAIEAAADMLHALGPNVLEASRRERNWREER